MPNDILVPVDGTPDSERILPWLRPFAALPGARTTFLRVVESAPVDQRGSPEASSARQQRLESARAYLEDLARRVRLDFGDAELVTAVGDPSDEIRRLAGRRRASLIAMEPHRGAAIVRGILGSVTDNILRTSPAPVLVAPATREAAQPFGWRPAAVVVPLDGSTLGEGALPLATELAGEFGVRVILVRGIGSAGYLAGVYGDLGLDVWTPDDAGGATDYLEGVAAGIRDEGLDVETRAHPEPGAAAVVAVLEEEPSALCVMVSHGRGGIQRLILGSVADKVVRAGAAPVIVIPSRSALLTRGADDLLAGDVMSSPAITIDPEATVGDAARLMLDRNIGCLPVVDAAGQMIGLVTEGQVVPSEMHIPFSRDVILTVFEQPVGELAHLEDALREASTLPITDAMIQQRPSVQEDTPLADAAAFMIREECSHVPVLRGSAVVGVIARHDLLRLLAPD